MKRKYLMFFSILIVVALFFAVYGVLAPNFENHTERRVLSDASDNLRSLIAAEDKHYQERGSYLPLDINSENLYTKNVLGWCVEGCSECDYAVSVSGLAYTAEVRCPVEENEYNYLGYVRTEPGSLIGTAGRYGKCGTDGIYANSRKLVNTVGPCGKNTWKSTVVVSGNTKRLAIETNPPDTSIYIDGELIGKTVSFHNTINESYGYIFINEPQNKPIEVIASKEGYSTVRFSLDWDSYTYHATIVLRPN